MESEAADLTFFDYVGLSPEEQLKVRRCLHPNRDVLEAEQPRPQPPQQPPRGPSTTAPQWPRPPVVPAPGHAPQQGHAHGPPVQPQQFFAAGPPLYVVNRQQQHNLPHHGLDQQQPPHMMQPYSGHQSQGQQATAQQMAISSYPNVYINNVTANVNVHQLANAAAASTGHGVGVGPQSAVPARMAPHPGQQQVDMAAAAHHLQQYAIPMQFMYPPELMAQNYMFSGYPAGAVLAPVSMGSGMTYYTAMPPVSTAPNAAMNGPPVVVSLKQQPLQQPPQQQQQQQHVPPQTQEEPVQEIVEENLEKNDDLEPQDEPEEEPVAEEEKVEVEMRHEETSPVTKDVSKEAEAAEHKRPEPSEASHQPKSWASLFHKEQEAASLAADASGHKPMARIPPFSGSDIVSQMDYDGGAHSAHVNGFSAACPGKKVALARFLCSYALNHRSLWLRPRGLTNRSNWCFANAVLQALMACPPFYNFIRELDAGFADARKDWKEQLGLPILHSVMQFVSEFEVMSHFPKLNNRNKNRKSEELPLGKSFEAQSVIQMLLGLPPDTFKVIEGRQEDAEEFLTFLLSGLSDEVVAALKLLDEPASSEGSEDGLGGEAAAAHSSDEWKEVGPKNKSCITRRHQSTVAEPSTPIGAMFQGQIRSCVTHTAAEPTATLQPFFTLQLDIQCADVHSVAEALASNFSTEELDGYVNPVTKERVDASRSLTLEELPPILVLHLKRFVYDEKSGGSQKLLKPIDFRVDLEVPRELLSATSKSKYGLKQRQYKLFSVVYHNGTEATKGHYVTDVYHAGLASWLRCDDSNVKAVPDSHVLAPTANSLPYILFYRRCDTMISVSGTERQHK